MNENRGACIGVYTRLFLKEGDNMKERLKKLIDVKSIVTIILTLVFAYLTIMCLITGEQFLTIFTVIISFYFGTQYAKNTNEDK